MWDKTVGIDWNFSKTVAQIVWRDATCSHSEMNSNMLTLHLISYMEAMLLMKNVRYAM